MKVLSRSLSRPFQGKKETKQYDHVEMDPWHRYLDLNYFDSLLSRGIHDIWRPMYDSSFSFLT